MGYWIVQCNPSKYDIFRYFKEQARPGVPDHWVARRYIKEVKIGDTVFIWIASGGGICESGIYAVGEVTVPPTKGLKQYDYEKHYWIDKAEEERLSNAPRLQQRYKKLFRDKPLLEKDLRNLPILKDLDIFKNHHNSIFKVTEKQGEAIMKLVLESDCE